MRQWTGSALVQVMACRLFGAEPLPEPVLACCQFDSWEQNSMKFEWEFFNFHCFKMHLQLSSAKMAAILSISMSNLHMCDSSSRSLWGPYLDRYRTHFGSKSCLLCTSGETSGYTHDKVDCRTEPLCRKCHSSRQIPSEKKRFNWMMTLVDFGLWNLFDTRFF